MLIDLRRITPNYAELLSQPERTNDTKWWLTAFVYRTGAKRSDLISATDKDLARCVVRVSQRRGLNAERKALEEAPI
jgi:hypothetical protein